MRNLKFGHVRQDILFRSGAVTLIHGGAGPIAQEMELSARAHADASATLESIKSMAMNRTTTIETPYGNGFDIFGDAKLTLAEAVSYHGIWQLEASPAFNAGYGSALQSDGRCRLTAAVMESSRRRLSAVVNVQGVCHPSTLAAALQYRQHGIRDGEGAVNLARQLRLPLEDPETPIQRERWRKWDQERKDPRSAAHQERSGTVGAVSCDAEGALCAITSTGGVGFEAPGRVGDVASVAGTYCTTHTAVSCTGFGEQIITAALAARIAVRLEDGQPPEDCLMRTLEEAEQDRFQFAFICLHRTPNGVLWAKGSTTRHCVWGLWSGLECRMNQE
jgi:L-asparaginase